MRDDIKEALEIVNELHDNFGEYLDEENYIPNPSIKITQYINELEQEIDELLDDVVIVSLDIDRGNVS